ncbi:MAG: (deoxy)nucleoside triphosphate pyrophosphohydrolase [Alphaproteobacteria bacterium]|nr:(deoxy)nucleoside triphosphate pyrophosphohydrolase [Alphaproteobacteria bacterium]
MLTNVLVSAVVLVDKNKKILMTTRPSGKKLSGFWEFPGGKVECGENSCQTAVRELKEEILVLVNETDLELFDTLKHNYDGLNFEIAVFICHNWKGDIKPQENQLYKWFELNEIDYNKILPANVKIIKKIYDFLQQNNINKIQHKT